MSAMRMEWAEAFSERPDTRPDEADSGEEDGSIRRPNEQMPERREAVPCVTEIVLTCSPRVLHGMVAAYETQIEQAKGELPLLLLWWGKSQKYEHGIIVLEWQGKVPCTFLDSLDIDAEVLDYLMYEDERVVFDTQEEPHPPGTANQEHASTNERPQETSITQRRDDP